jgi:hypothetical protein
VWVTKERVRDRDVDGWDVCTFGITRLCRPRRVKEKYQVLETRTIEEDVQEDVYSDVVNVETFKQPQTGVVSFSYEAEGINTDALDQSMKGRTVEWTDFGPPILIKTHQE